VCVCVCKSRGERRSQWTEVKGKVEVEGKVWGRRKGNK
jgi:hypothetical protein